MKEKTKWILKLNEENKKNDKLVEKLRAEKAAEEGKRLEAEKKVEVIEKNFNNLQENQERLQNSQQTANTVADQALQLNATFGAENERLKKKVEKCLDRNCFSTKKCKKSHDHKSRMDTPCYFFMRGWCRNGSECKDYHPEEERERQEIKRK